MKRYIGLAFAIYVVWVLLFVLEKPVFLFFYLHSLEALGPVVSHGAILDFAMAGYLSVLPFLALVIKPYVPDRAHSWFLRVYFAVASLAVALSFVANLALYGYWQFPLDATPLFYFLSSPADALASAPWYVEVGALLIVVILAAAICLLFRTLYRKILNDPCSRPLFKTKGKKLSDTLADAQSCIAIHSTEIGCCQPMTLRKKIATSVVLFLLMAFLFLPIRGGVTVSTNNTGKVYFSDIQLLNHAAVNPFFSFMESMQRQKDFGKQYRFMDDRQAAQTVTDFHQRLLAATKNRGESGTSSSTEQQAQNNAVPTILHEFHPDIYLIIMESFSDTVTKVPGVTPYLNRLRREGLYFANFYANSFRTDRGLLSILMGFPSPATVSLMKYPEKTSKMSSIAAHLAKVGYVRNYYYGGDADFTNMRSFLINQGFQHIIEDRDFPVGDRLSKWGVCDHLLFQKVETELEEDRQAVSRRTDGQAGRVQPVFTVIQTSSSHEPFDVPYHQLNDPALNAFAYADKSIGDFVDYLRRDKARWERSLVILVPDHLGAWPSHPDDFQPWRFHVPMIWIGGALNEKALSEYFGTPHVVSDYGSQQDIAATLLGQVGKKGHVGMLKNMPFSKNILDPSVPHYAWFMMHDGEGLATFNGCVIYDNQRKKTVYTARKTSKDWIESSTEMCKAYVQRLFDYIAKL